jgi:hypothetical protein
MRIASRHMKKYERRGPGWLGWLVLASFVIAMVAWLASAVLKHPVPTLVVIAVVGAFAVVSSQHDKRRIAALRRLGQWRHGQSICNFAREFNLREVDPWVVRAVYEQLQAELREVHPNFPIRAADKLVGSLVLDADDLDMGLIQEIEARTMRSLNRSNDNPYYGRVLTVRELVLFFNAQPRTSATS